LDSYNTTRELHEGEAQFSIEKSPQSFNIKIESTLKDQLLTLIYYLASIHTGLRE